MRRAVPRTLGGNGLLRLEGGWRRRVAPARSEPSTAGGDQAKAMNQAREDWGMSGPKQFAVPGWLLLCWV